MEINYEKNFIISPVFIWILVALNYWAVLTFAFFHSPIIEESFISGLKIGIITITWILFLADALGTSIHKKNFWVVVLIVTPLIAYPFYLIRRRRN